MKITIRMEPVAKARPRMNISNGQAHSYIPEKTQKAQDYLKAFLYQYVRDKFAAYTPVKLSAVFYRTKSKWAPKKDIIPVRKPDIDNFLKLLLDGCNHLLVEDDAQFTSISVSKRWSRKPYGYITMELKEDTL